MLLEIKIISLKKDENKRNNILCQLNNIHNVSVVDAVNGKMLLAEDFFKLSKVKSSKFYVRKFSTPSELGCFLSHKKAIKEFLDKDSDWVLILEDDVDMINNINKIRLEELDPNRIYILGGQEGLPSFNRIIFGNCDSQGFSPARFGTDRWIFRTCSYMLSRSLAEEIYNLMCEFTFIADDWVLIRKNTSAIGLSFKHFFAHPLDLSLSSIESERAFLK